MGKNTVYSRIYETVNHIPRGKVATYGQIAGLAGILGHARQVGYALHSLPDGSCVPWHRVINRKGQISLRSNPSAALVQRALLESEGIVFNPQETIALKEYQWHATRPLGGPKSRRVVKPARRNGERTESTTSERDTLPPAVRDIRIRFLGSGDNFGSGGRFQACIHVDSGASRFLLDCGASSLIPMKRAGISSAAIDCILISHLHGDHFGGIPFFIIDAQLISRREAPLVIAGPPGLKQRVREAMEVFYPGSAGIERKFAIDYVELTEGAITPVGALTVLPVRAIHGSGAPSYAYRIGCAGKSIAYSGDSEWTDALRTVADGADLFICESYFFDKQMKNHLSYRTLMAHRAELGCERLIITHLGEDLLDRLGEVELEVAHDGLELLI